MRGWEWEYHCQAWGENGGERGGQHSQGLRASWFGPYVPGHILDTDGLVPTGSAPAGPGRH